MSSEKQRKITMPKGGWCRKRIKERAENKVFALLFFVVGVIMLVNFIVPLAAGGSALTDISPVIAAAVIGLIVFGVGGYIGYCSLHDTFVPAQSRIARSIRSQLEYPDSAPPVDELFEMVDKDIDENGEWFGRAAVGDEWLFGDEASLLSRVRVVFGLKAIQHHRSHGSRTYNRTIRLYVMDDRHQIQETRLYEYNDLDELLEYLQQRLPDALFRPYSEFGKYKKMTDREWYALEQEYIARKQQREKEYETQQNA
ncbi:MAG: hypothetical protein J1E39_06455 [Eubacterium sp.]|nr:hypothetical protein [Eubacterium sp.]